jgi:preprotein translocase subunit SecE
MADENSSDEETTTDVASEGESSPAEGETALVKATGARGGVDLIAAEARPVSELGVERYVHAAFLAAAVISAYVLGKIFAAAWSYLLDWPDAVRRFPQLLEYSEDQRGSLTLLIGTVLGALIVLRYYRRPFVRNWATGVAGELSRVTWPSKDAVTSGTVVVLVAGAVATFYVAVLDRLWGYLTNLVYGT